MTRDQFNRRSLGSLNQMVKDARVLMVGAGGIGCELLKNLALTGYGEIHIVDLDTIDLSNLNRQFLFRTEHIKKSKALVAKEAAQKFNPNVKLVAHFDNIKDAQFNIDWFKGFTMVFNALDNLDARRHVNKMCIAADIPLVESGTTGFNGQVQVIKRGVTACYDCTEKAAPKSFPVCTIRSTPSQPIHCIVWGKNYLLGEVFGVSEDSSEELDHSADSENAKEIEKLRQEAEALRQITDAMGTEDFPRLLFDKVYKDDVNRLRSMEDMWKSRRPPEPLSYNTIIEVSAVAELGKDEILKDDQRVWDLHENVVVFKDSLQRLSTRFIAQKKDSNIEEAVILFDKDDDDTLDFVTASANIRSSIFGIESKSRFDVKQMAGNIIPAIATTNAIVAGLCVLQSFKILRNDISSTKEVFLSPFTHERLLTSDRMPGPNPDCKVCGVARSRILVDLSRATLNDLVEGCLKSRLGYGDEIAVYHADNMLYDVDEADNLEILNKKLRDLGIKEDSFLTVMDDDDENSKDPRINLVLSVQEFSIPEDEVPIRTLDIRDRDESDQPTSPIARRKKPTPQESNGDRQNGISNGTVNGHSNGINGSVSDITFIDSASKKRGATEALGDGSPSSKRSKTLSNGKDKDVILIEDADGAIMID